MWNQGLTMLCLSAKPVENNKVGAAQHNSNLVAKLTSLISVTMSSSYFWETPNLQESVSIWTAALLFSTYLFHDTVTAKIRIASEIHIEQKYCDQ